MEAVRDGMSFRAARPLAWLGLALLLLALAGGAAPARAETRALVIALGYGGAADQSLGLANTLVDGRNVASGLREAGIADVTLVEEPDPAAWDAAIDAFVARLAPDDIAFVYYAGHGIQVAGRNYFLAADGRSLIEMDPMMRRLTGTARGTIMVVDACRSNPFAQPGRGETLRVASAGGATRAMETVTIDQLAGSSGGLAQLGDLRGLSAVVLFSTEPGNVAEDGPAGQGSPFAQVLSREIKRRQSLDRAFRRIAVAVNRSTDGRQSPWRQGDLPFDVYLAGMQDFPVP